MEWGGLTVPHLLAQVLDLLHQIIGDTAIQQFLLWTVYNQWFTVVKITFIYNAFFFWEWCKEFCCCCCCCNTQDGPHIILMCFIFILLMTFLSLFIHHLTSHLHGEFVRAIVNDVLHFCRLITDLFHMAQWFLGCSERLLVQTLQRVFNVVYFVPGQKFLSSTGLYRNTYSIPIFWESRKLPFCRFTKTALYLSSWLN